MQPPGAQYFFQTTIAENLHTLSYLFKNTIIDRNVLCDGQTIKQADCVSSVTTAQDVGRQCRATKNAVIKYHAALRAV